mmetsp:Transcript_24782/g.56019  ORF Transcript_24782/g.56019 Transcript_24782/m.56019 type:complete len:286 (-) Transcript_24782:320-1177(-)
MVWLSSVNDVAGVISSVDERQINEDDLSKPGGPVDETAARQLRLSLGQDKCASLPDGFLEKCLVYQSSDPERAETIIEGFLRFRTEARWSFRIPADEVETALRSGLHWLLWGKSADDAEGPAACLVFNMAALDCQACSVEEYQKLSMFLMERATDHLAVQRRGVALVVDFRGAQFSKLSAKMHVEDLKRGLRCWVGSFPCRMRRIWLLGAPSPVRWLTSAMARLLSPKVRARIRFAEATALKTVQEDLGDFIDLPPALGGTAQFDWDEEVMLYLDEPKSPTRLSL